jgi:hypothetical protein
MYTQPKTIRSEFSKPAVEKLRTWVCKSISLCCIGLGLLVWMAIWAVAARKTLKSDVASFESLINNWKSDFITDIELSSTTTCPAGTTRAFEGSWQGTDNGCNCLGVRCRLRGVPAGRLVTGSCNYNSTRCGCDNVPNSSSKSLISTGNPTICVKRALNQNFFNLYTKMTANGACISGFQKCGDASGNSMGVCVPNADACPLT